MNKFLKEFKDRGYFYQCTSEKELSELLNNEKKDIHLNRFDERYINGWSGFVCYKI